MHNPILQQIVDLPPIERISRLYQCGTCQKLIVTETITPSRHRCRDSNGRRLMSHGNLLFVASGSPDAIAGWALSILQGVDSEFKF
jgi:DNA-directed RNA polymerase subunit RPC12/RpoP